MREVKIGKNDCGQRLDKFLTKALDVPQSLLYKFIRTKKIKVNRKRAEINQQLSEGDLLQLFISDEFFKDTKRATVADGTGTAGAATLGRIKYSLDIAYEDENIIVVNKPAGISVHED